MTVLDTSVIIDFIAGDKKVVSLIDELSNSDDVSTTCITEYELLKHKAKLKRQLAEDLISELTVYQFDSAAAREAAKLFITLKDNGKMINENDLLIAGIALANNEVLLTRDQKLANAVKINIKII